MTKEKTSNKRNYDVTFFYEKNLRAFLSKFYFSIVESKNNAKEIRDVGLDDFTPKSIGGNLDAQSATEDVFKSLEYARMFLKNEQIFESQIMDPLRIACDLRLQLGEFEGGKRSSDVEGLVFARSRQYEEDDDMDVTLSLICPKLQSVMSIRVPEDSISKNNGWFEFEKVQPIVLVNRLHPTPGTKTVINELEKKKDLFEFSFIFSSIVDLYSFSKSIEMENFSEIYSTQSDKRRHLGCAFVSFGRVSHFDEPDISIESLLNGEEITLTIASRNFKKNSPNPIPEDITGKIVTFLGVMWYKTGAKNDIKMDFPELLDLQLCDDELLASVSEIIGFVRLRRKCSTEILKKDLKIDDERFGNFLSSIKKSPRMKIVEVNGSLEIHYEVEVFSEPVQSAYVKSLEAIRKLREGARTAPVIQVTEETLVDKNKTNTEAMIRQLYFNCKSHEKFGCKIRLRILKEVGSFEEQGENLDSDEHLGMFTDSSHTTETVRKQLWFLKNIVGFVDKKNKKYFLTKGGKEILTRIREKESEKFLSNAGQIVDLLNVPDYIHIPSLLKFLQDPGNQFSPFEKKPIKTKIFWTKTNSENTEIRPGRIESYQKIYREILSLMIKRSYPMNSEKISEELAVKGIKIKRPVLELFLEDITKTYRLKEKEGYYEYVVEARIHDFFEKNADKHFTVPEIISGIQIPRIDIDLGKSNSVIVENILSAFEENGIILKINSKWTSAENFAEKQEKELKSTIRFEAISILKQRKTMERNELEDMINGIARKSFKISGTDLKNKISETLSEMICKNEMYSDGYVIKYSEITR